MVQDSFETSVGVLESEPESGLPERTVGKMLGRANRISNRLANRRLTEFNLKIGEYAVLRELDRCDGATITQLAKKASVAYPQVIGVVRRLKLKGLVVDRRSGEDGRARCVFLTPQAQELISQHFGGLVRDLKSDLTLGLSREEVEEFFRILSKIVETHSGSNSVGDSQGQ